MEGVEVEIMNIFDLKEKIIQLDWRIKDLLEESGYLDIGDIDVEYDCVDPEQNYLFTELWRILFHLDYSHEILECLLSPIIHEGILIVNQNGCYEVDGVELTCGSSLEVLLPNEESEYLEWVASRIDYDNGYYLVGNRDLSLEGIRARIRAMIFLQ